MNSGFSGNWKAPFTRFRAAPQDPELASERVNPALILVGIFHCPLLILLEAWRWDTTLCSCHPERGHSAAAL